MSKNFFIIEDHTITNIGLQKIIPQKTDLICSGFAFTKSEAEEKLEKLFLDSQKNLNSASFPNLIILDLFLGAENGLDVLQTIRTKYKDVKVLVYSMYAKPGILSLTLEKGANGFVEKSAPESILIEAINSILKGENFIQQSLVSPLITYKTMYDGLTRQEQKILSLILEQKTKSQISATLNIVPRTVDNYISRILDKTGAKNIDDIVKKFC